MNKNTSLVLGSVFILASGFIYTIERLNAYVYWLGQTNTGSWETNPGASFFDNIFTLLFLIIGIGLIVFAIKKN